MISSPNGRNIDKEGIAPDILFENTDDSEAMWSRAANLIKRNQWQP